MKNFNLGIVHNGPFLLYGSHCGLRLPMWLAHFIVHYWNRVACRIWGHDDILWHLAEAGHISPEEARCSNCSKQLAACTVYHNRWASGRRPDGR